MAAIKVVDIFAQLGARVDVKGLNLYQKRLGMLKKQLISLRKLSSTKLSPDTNLSEVRKLNVELENALRLAKKIKAEGPIRVARTGGGGGRGGRGGRGGGAGGAAAGFLAGSGQGRTSALGRGFIGTFTASIVTRQLFQADVAINQIRTALEATLRPGQQLSDEIGFLRSEAERLGFDFQKSALEFAKLKAAGNAAGLELDEIREIFISAQEASRIFGLSTADTEGVLKAFTQIISKGKVTAEELRNQLGDRLPAAVPLFAKALGVTTQQLSKMLEDGEVLANETLPKFAKTLRAEFGGQIPQASARLDSRLNELRNTFLEFKASIIDGAGADLFKVAIVGLTRALKVLQPIFRGLIFTLRLVISPFQALGRIVNRIPPMMQTIILLVGAATLAFLKWGLVVTTQQLLIAGSILRLVAIYTLLIFLIDDLLTTFEGGDSIFSRVVERFNEITEAGGFLTSFFTGFLQLVRSIVETIAELTAALVFAIESGGKFKEAFSEFGGNAAEFGGNVIGAIGDNTLRAVGFDELADDLILRNAARRTARVTVQQTINPSAGMDEEALADLVVSKQNEALVNTIAEFGETE